MKYVYVYLITLGFLMIGCQEEQPKNYYLPVIIDCSETNSYAPLADDIKSYLSGSGLNDGITIALRYISDTPYALTYSFVFEQGATGLLSNEDQRRKKTKRFYRQFKDSLSYYNSLQLPLRRSFIWNSVAAELWEASKQGIPVDILLFSDLKEHSGFSVYDSKNRFLLSRNPSKVSEQFLASAGLPKSLSSVSLHILYTPTLEDAQLFGDMLAVYKSLIESRGGKVIVGKHKTIH